MNNSSRPGSPTGINNNAGSVVSNIGSVTSLGSNLNEKFAQFNAFRTEQSAKAAKYRNKVSQNALKARNTYTKKKNSAIKTWMASHGNPKGLPSSEQARINQEAKNYVKRLYGHNVYKATFAGGKRRRSTRKGRKNRRNTRKNRR